MDTTLADNTHDLALGVGAGVLAMLLGLVLSGIAVTGAVGVLDHPAVAGVALGFAFAYGVAGLYEITARGVTNRGVADLTVGAGLVLALLGPYGTNRQAFVLAGALALVAAGVYHAALAADVVAVGEEPSVEVDGDEAT